MASENITICPVCNHDTFSPYNSAKDYTVSGEVFTLIQCSACQFIITSPRPAKNSIARYYLSDDYISHSGKSKTLFDKIYLTARKFTLKWKHQLIADHSTHAQAILDYGCGTGEFLKHMKNRGWQIEGVEPAANARTKANEQLGNAVSETLQTVKLQSFNIITLWHVLEHIHDLNDTIQHLKHLLAKDGKMIIAVPNPKSHDSQNYQNNWAGYDVPRHLWHFTQSTMDALLKKNGLKIVETRPMKLDSYYVCLLSEGYNNLKQHKLISGIKALIEGTLSNRKAKKSKEYSSLTYIAKSA